MNREDIIRMAREAGLYATRQTSDPYDWQAIRDERFFHAAYAAGAAAEREACAKAAEDMCEYGKPYSAAAAIRARGNA